jgi:hypothetical protein
MRLNTFSLQEARQAHSLSFAFAARLILPHIPKMDMNFHTELSG